MLPPYRVSSVEKIEVPTDGSGDRWCHYILENGLSTISGRRTGTVKQVTKYAIDFAKELNGRRKSASYYSMSSRRKK